MRGIMLKVGAIAFAIMANSGAASAKTGDIACLWGHLPADLRAEIIDKSARGEDFIGVVKARYGAFREAATVCGVDLGSGAGKAMAGFVEAHGRAVVLSSRYGLEESRVQAAWASLPEADRVRFVANFSKVHVNDGTDDNFIHLTVNRICETLGVTDAAEHDVVFHYLIAQARFAAMEPTF